MIIGRGFGILLHITSLPGKYPVGDMGPEAYRFVDLLSDIGASYWQVLPLNPTSLETANSPYSSVSAFAGNPLLISPEKLVDEGLIKASEVRGIENKCLRKVCYSDAYKLKEHILAKAFENINKEGNLHHLPGFDNFIEENRYWLEDYALFMTIKKIMEKPWYEWPERLRRHDITALSEIRERHSDIVQYYYFEQYVFERQWSHLKRYANRKGINIFGDIPIYVSLDSADVWGHQDIFKLRKDGRPEYVSGVPPDYFSPTGQLWGTPVYNWENLRDTGFKWWIERLRRTCKLYDLVRIDHFRGLIAYWEVPGDAETAINGKWVKVPYEEFFKTITKYFPVLPFVAEDLGVITPDVREVMREYGLPGMKVLVFAWSDPGNPYLPHNHGENYVVYTSTHDTNTVKGWFIEEATEEQRKFIASYTGVDVNHNNISRVFIRLALMSVSRLAIIPVQDILGLGSEARMNRPGTTIGNWEWRMMPSELESPLFYEIGGLAELYGRK